MGRICPRCHRAIRRGEVHRCPLAEPSSRDLERERERHRADGWRSGYDAEYQRARRFVLDSCGGRCEATGEPVFERTGRGWRRIHEGSGGTHHIVPLSRGGRNDPGNIVCLSARAHGIAHTAACAGARTKGELLCSIRREMGLL